MSYNKYAFISYQRNDSFYAKLLSLRMSLYILPHERPNEFTNSRRLTPVWRDREELTSGDELTPDIEKAIDTAKYLIVFCSENSLKTTWVDKEVARFLEKHDVTHVIPYVLPTKGKEIHYVDSLAKAISEKQEEDENYVFLDIRHEQEELEIGLIHRLIPWLFRLDKSYVRVIARTLDLNFSAVWNSYNKFIRRVIRTVIAIFTVMLMIGLYFGVPISLPVEIKDQMPTDSLPKAKNIVMKVAGAEYPIQSVDTTLVLRDIPGKYRFRNIPIEITATYYLPFKNVINPGIGIGKTCDVSMKRDSTFAIYYGIVTDLNGHAVDGAYVKVGHVETTTNINGEFRITFDLKDQTYSKHIYIEKEGIGTKDILEGYPDSSQYVLK